jgi:hypothetical protein
LVLQEQRLQNRLAKIVEKTKADITQFLGKNRYRQYQPSDSHTINEVQLAEEIDSLKLKMPDASSVVLFAVSGSGKTRSIERLVSRHFGFFFQACSVPSRPQGLHDARRTSGSRDSFLLGKMI